MVGLDLTLTDQTLIAYTKKLFEALGPEKIYFVHIQKDYKYPEELELMAAEPPSREMIRARLEDMTRGQFPEDIVECEVYQGDPLFDLWKETYLHGVDLFIAGSKADHKGRGLVPKRFTKKSFCSTLFIPDKVTVRFRNIFLPIDFSDYSKDALELSLELAASQKDCEITCQNVYELPYAYSLTDSPRQRYVELMEKNANTQFEEFIQGIDTGDAELKTLFQVRDYPYVAEHIKNEAEVHEADIIIMAAGGKSRLSRIFLGSETEKMVEMEKSIPLLILKEKEKKVKLWDIITAI